MLEKALDASDGLVSLPNLTLPPFTIYTADAAKLGELPLPAPREIAYFYAQIASMQDDLARLAKAPFLEGPAGGKTEREYGASSTNSMRRYVLAIIFSANCGKFFRRNIRSL